MSIILPLGKVNGQDAIPYSIKLVIIDTIHNTMHSHIFPSTVAPYTSFMNDVVVENRHGSYFAYMTDSGLVDGDERYALNGGLVAYSLDDDVSVRILHRHPSVQDDRTLWFTIGEQNNEYFADPNAVHVFPDGRMRTGADGIALSCDFEWVYYTPLTSRHMYAIRTSEIKQHLKGEYVNISVEYAGYKYCTSDGFAMDSHRRIYLSCLEQNSVLVNSYAEKGQFGTKAVVDRNVLVSGKDMRWPDTFAIHDNYLYFVSNQLDKFVGGVMTFGVCESTSGSFI